ncbi:MAG: exo-alpha-sialidase [Phycisphaerales bacterium]|nr:exo-alpha-sialidase [Phycisphaerales bacterium]
MTPWITLALTAITLTDPPAGPGALAPHLAPAPGGPLLSWLEPVPDRPEDGVYALRVSRFGEGGWSPPRTIVAGDRFFANWADVPMLAVTADDAWIASWLQRSGADTYAYDVVLARSRDEGQTWTRLGSPHDDGTETEHGFVSMVATEGGIRIVWLDGRAMATDATGAPRGSGDMTLRSTVIDSNTGPDIGRTDILDPRVCECCNTAAALTDRGPVVVYRDRGEDETRDISIVRRVDERWTTPVPVHRDGWRIAGCPVNGPAIAAREDRVVVAWYTGAPEAGAVRVAFSSDAGARFAAPVTVDDTWPTGRVGVHLEPNGDAVVSWLDAHAEGGAIVARRVRPDGSQGPAITIAPTTLARAGGFPRLLALDDKRLLVVWTEVGEVNRLRSAVLTSDRLDTQSSE